MGNLLYQSRKRFIFLGVSFFIVAFSLTALFSNFFHAYAANPTQLTGCLSTNPGLLYNLKSGSSPINPCPTGDPQISWSTDDLTSGWTAINDTWTYSSSTTITVPSDATTQYSVGGKIRLKQGAGYKYFYVIGVSSTTLTVTGGSDYSVANAAITDIGYSNAVSQVGFPDWFNWSPSGVTWDGTAPTSPSQSTFKFSLKGKTCFFKAKREYSNAGSSNTVVNFDLPISPVGEVSEYNMPGSGYISTLAAGSPPSTSNHRSFVYGTSGAQFYIYVDSGIAAKTFWASGFYEI